MNFLDVLDLFPLDQFKIKIISLISISDFFEISITNFIILISFIFLFLNLLLLLLFADNPKLISTKIQIFFELIYVFVKNLIKMQIGTKGLKFFTVLFIIFLFIVTSNLLSLIPFGFTITAHIFVSLLLALASNFSVLFTMVKLRGFFFFFFFWPSFAPMAVRPLICVIEIMSFLIRNISLSFRLFANLVSGHILLYILFVLLFNITQLQLYFFALILFYIIFAIVLLELFISILQGYVFILLITIYLQEVL